MSAISSEGYQNLRDYVQANWKYIEFRDASANPILRIGVGDSRVTWTHTPGAQTLELTAVIKGSDSDVSGLLPKTFASAAIFSVASGGTALSSEAFSNFTMSVSSDQMTVQYQIEVPQVV